MPDYMTTKQAAKKWGINERRVRVLCEQGRIPGAFHLGRSWAIPEDAKNPAGPSGRPKQRPDK